MSDTIKWRFVEYDNDNPDHNIELRAILEIMNGKTYAAVVGLLWLFAATRGLGLA